MTTLSSPPTPTRARSDWPKHAIIWAILAIELFPIYMMLQVSIKDNTGFLLNPWLPTDPATWL